MGWIDLEGLKEAYASAPLESLGSGYFFDPSVAQPPLPLQEFLPLQPLSPLLQPPWPLQPFLPLQELVSLSAMVETFTPDWPAEALAAWTEAAVPVRSPAIAAAARVCVLQ